MSQLRKTILSILTLLVLSGGACWFYADSLLNALVRPRLEQAAARALDAQVKIERISWTARGVEIFGLELQRAQGLKLRVAQIETEFSLSGLLQHRLDVLHIVRPQLEFTPSTHKSTAEQAPFRWPADLPLTINQLTLVGGEALFEFEGRSLLLREVSIQGALRPEFPFQVDLSIGPDNAHPLRIGGRFQLDSNLTLTLDRVDFQQRSLIVQPLSLALAGGGLEQGRVSIHLARVDQQQVQAILSSLGVGPVLPDELHFFLNATQISLNLSAEETRVDVQIATGQVSRAQLRLPFGLARLALSLKGGGWSARGELSGPVDTALEFSASSQPPDAVLDSFLLDLQQAGSPLLKLAGNLEKIQFGLAPLSRARLQALLALLDPEFRLPQLKALSSLTANGSLAKSAEGGWAVQGEFGSEQIQLADLTLKQVTGQLQLQAFADRLLVEAFSLSGLVAKGDELSARFAGEVSGVITEKQLRAKLERIRLTEIGYLSADGQTGLGGGHLDLQGSVSAASRQGPFVFSLRGSGGAAEALAGSFYANLSPLGGSLSLGGDFTPQSQTLNLAALQLELPSLGALKLAGVFNPAKMDLNAQLEFPDLAKVHGKPLGPALAEAYPALGGLVLKGSLSGEADFHRQADGWQLSGTLHPQGLDVFWKEQALELRDGTGRIPFNLFSGQASLAAGGNSVRPGEISFSSLSVGLASLEAGRLQLAAAPNRIAFRSPLKLSLAGGRVVITDLSLGRNSTGPYGSVRVNIAAVDLAILARELKLPPLQGSFTGDLGLIHFADRQLSTAGTAALGIFGGNLHLRNMRYQAPFSRYPVFFADIDFSGIDLLQATQTFEFGEMNGIVDGQIHGLRLFGTTPSAFNARLETRTTGKRNISVKALNNLTIISQGGLSAALSRGVYRFIDFYRYDKIGFACTLENDTFTLVGTARSDSSKYLVAGSFLPPRIDITTTTPTISFKEMLKRLNRIDRAGS